MAKDKDDAAAVDDQWGRTGRRVFMQFNELLLNLDGIDHVVKNENGFTCYMRSAAVVEVKGGSWAVIRQALGFSPESAN